MGNSSRSSTGLAAGAGACVLFSVSARDARRLANCRGGWQEGLGDDTQRGDACEVGLGGGNEDEIEDASRLAGAFRDGIGDELADELDHAMSCKKERVAAAAAVVVVVASLAF